eukprot:5336-Hanusia_phi.AAC.1
MRAAACCGPRSRSQQVLELSLHRCDLFLARTSPPQPHLSTARLSWSSGGVGGSDGARGQEQDFEQRGRGHG